ncbi:M20 family metallopeptidase [Halostella sp. JP-L12]|uniref:M20 family metallopeptidase n=1 Tax=Halostella TaxID=1843185 RepID=UPI000EF78D65|nr:MULTISPECIES: M20 family metallopeptidase [Halostella]NHN48055.1 M20 family metallopeptidase [Halostella sp. JP-L12]
MDNTEVTELIQELVRIETENPPGNELKCAEYIHGWFKEHEIETELIDEPVEDRPQVVARIGDGDPTLVLNGHTDVVPAGDREKWTYGPYSGTVDNGKIYGRGAVDMKTGLAIGMLTTRDIGKELERGDSSGSIIFHGAMGEETGDPGTKTLLEKGYTGEYGVVLEPTGMRVATATKGTAWYTITVSGEPSHASRPDQGTNAIENANHVIEALTDYGTDVRSREDELVGTAFATLTEFSAGTKENIVPERAEITLDRRVLPDERFEDLDEELNSILEQLADEHGIETEWKQYQIYEPSLTPEESRVTDVFRRNVAELTDVPTEPWGIPAATDTRDLINSAEMDAITWGPGDISQAHTFDEYIYEQEAVDGLHVLKQAARELLQ